MSYVTDHDDDQTQWQKHFSFTGSIDVHILGQIMPKHSTFYDVAPSQNKGGSWACLLRHLSYKI